MSAPIAKTQFVFELPNQSYVDVRLEEPNLRAAAEAAAVRPAPRGLLARFSDAVSQFIAWNRDLEARAELNGLSDYELRDMGLTRSDLPRVFEPNHNRDLIDRVTAH